MTAPAVRIPTEQECEDTIVDAARRLGYLVHAERPARTATSWRTPVKGDAGWPDLVIAGHGRLWIVELKRKPNRLDPRQVEWNRRLTAAGVDARVVWVPSGQQALIDELTDHARKAR